MHIGAGEWAFVRFFGMLKGNVVGMTPDSELALSTM